MKGQVLDLHLDDEPTDDVPLVTEVAEQTPEQKALAQLLRSEARMKAQMVAILKTVKRQREEQRARHEQFEKDMAARRRRGVFTSSEARRWSVFTMTVTAVLSFILGNFIGGLY